MYEFKRDDTGEIFEATFDQMMAATNGLMEVEPGVWAKRVNRSAVKSAAVRKAAPIVSDSMGFGIGQLSEMEAHRKASGVRGIEFKPDPTVPEFIQVHCTTERAKQRYMESRQFTDMNTSNGSGCVLSPQMLQDAKELVLRTEKKIYDGKN